MSTSLILVYLAVALTFSTCTAHRNRWWNSPRPEISLRRLHCDKVEQFGLCGCCPVDPCDGVECFNGGQCVGDGVCNCTFGFGGANCNRRVCNVTECTDRDGVCTFYRCINNATNCAGKVCNTINNELCIDDTCVGEGRYNMLPVLH
ncbi:hypothetical protein SNE40_001701 [Patella caerulea]|uniref:EGF-like domain-containing protein n=1 Tax=Patella caerulea TaxID=87958 RepID=A0AAN8K6B1_PATCE